MFNFSAMNIFFAAAIQGDQAILTEEEARHCVQVLRMKVGDPILLVDGQGGYYEAELVEAHKKSCAAKIIKQEQAFGKRDFHLHLAVAPTKNIARMEWLCEKATELGIDEISPIICQRSERRKVRIDRLEKIVLSAMKQSGKAYLPKIHPLQDFKSWVEECTNAAHLDQRFIAHCMDGPKRHLKEEYKAPKNVVILIGPEGDFSPEELAFAQKNGFDAVHLGTSRLRTETAALMACAVIHFNNT